MGGCIDGWMDGLVGKWVGGGLVDEWVGGWLDGLVGGWIDGGSMDGFKRIGG